MMQKLDFQSYPFRIRQQGSKYFVFDVVRKKYVLLTPEEWVRQHVLWFLIQNKGYPLALLSVEKELITSGISKRYDIVAYTSQGHINLVVECKAPSVRLTQKVFDQIARYNLALNARNLMITNGIEHYFCQIDYQQKKYVFLDNLPTYQP